MSIKFEKGMKTREAVLGSGYLDKVKENISKFDKNFQKLITEYVWGSIWSNDNISKRERSMLTIAILASQGNLDELKLHLQACKNTNTSTDDLIEVMMHVAIYSGIPKANTAIKLIKEELKDWK